MKRIPPALTYTVLRLLTFIVPLAILLLLGFNEWFSAIIAAIIGFAFSLIFLQRSRAQVSTAIHNKRTGADADEPHEVPTDEEAEDDVVDHVIEHDTVEDAADEDDTASDDTPPNAESGSVDPAARAHVNDEPSP